MIKKYTGALALMLMLLSSCSQSEQAKDDQSKQETSKGVVTVKSELSNQTQEMILSGKVEYDPDKVVNFVPLLDGVVDRTYFSLGDKVQKGQSMLDIRSTELSGLQSERLSLETDEKIAQRELETAQSMYDDGMLSEKELLEAQGKLKQTRASLNKILADVSVYGVNKGSSSLSVKAPITGHVVAKDVSSGSTISSGSDPLFTIADLNTIWIVANVYASNLQFVSEGMNVEITSLSYPNEIFYAKINSISQVFDPTEKVLKARIVMQNKGLKFKPEMPVLVKVKNENLAKCISIPSEALIFDDNRYFVVVEESKGNFVSKEVVLSGHNGKTSFIASGLHKGEDVVISNQLLIYSDLKKI